MGAVVRGTDGAMQFPGSLLNAFGRGLKFLGLLAQFFPARPGFFFSSSAERSQLRFDFFAITFRSR